MRKLWPPAVLTAALLLAAGCSSSGTSAPPGGGTSVAPRSTAPAVTTPVAPTHSTSTKPLSPANAEIAAAIGHAEHSGKRVLIDFGAGWCVDCRVLDTIFERPAVAPTVKKNYVVVPVNVHNFNFNMDISRKRALAVAKALSGAGFPAATRRRRTARRA